MTLSEEGDDLLHREAELLGRHLVGRPPGAELAARYAAASRRLLAGAGDARDRALLAFVHRRPWSFPFLDAAGGLLAPRSLLRRKALVMTAVLEATPDFVGDFLPRPTSAPGFVARGAWLGARALAKAVVGVCLWPIATRSGRAG